jgi:Flp pilus assembly protein TadG
MQAVRPTSTERSRRGAVAVLMTFLFPVVLVIGFLSVNVAYMLLLRTELRVATDAAARAAGATYSATNNEAAAIDAAQEIALLNKVGGQGLVLDDEDVQFGRSQQPSAGARYEFVVDGGTKNSARINATADSRALFGGQLFDDATFSPSQTATASYDNVDICLVLDRSSSMKLSTWETSPAMSTSDSRFCQLPNANSRWKALESAVSAFVSVLQSTGAQEHVGVVTYASDYTMPCSPSSFSPKSRIDSQLSGNLNNTTSAMTTLSATNWGGNTDIAAGVVMGRTVLNHPTYSRPNARKVMIVLTDGHYTAANPLQEGQTAASQGMIVHTVTFGDGANQSAMEDLAEAAHGSFHHAPDPTTLEAVFRKLAAMSVLLTD